MKHTRVAAGPQQGSVRARLLLNKLLQIFLKPAPGSGAKTRNGDTMTSNLSFPDMSPLRAGLRAARATQPDFEGAKTCALRMLGTELDPRLTYHCLEHTSDSVLPAVKRLASVEGVSRHDLQLLCTAALYHDIGFLVQQDNHELAGTEIVAQILPGFGYSAGQIETIQGIIMATKLPQSPRNRLEELMADADLNSLGQPTFWHWSGLLRAEWATFGRAFDDAQWYRSQIGFLSGHRYFTKAARVLWAPVKQEHIRQLETLLQASEREEARGREFLCS
jgi:uncharacterized protein